MKSSLFPPLVLALGASVAQADEITGRVVDEFGVGIAGVDIDVENEGSGGDPPIFNDGTDANGFFTTTLPAGIYTVTFIPPPPPAASSMIGEVEDFIVVGTTNMGTIELDAAFGLTGRVVDDSGLPVSGVNFDVIDSTGDNVDLAHDVSALDGTFGIAVPPGNIELRLDTFPTGQAVAPIEVPVFMGGDVHLGDIALEDGFFVTGVVRHGASQPVVNADLDVFDSTTGEQLFTPRDNTGPSGLFTLLLPAGTYDVEICPDPTPLLTGGGLENQVINANTSLGLITLLPGVLLTGTVTDFNGLPVPGADVDVVDSVTGNTIVTCDDNANAAGQYSVVVPLGTFDIDFEPPGFSLPLGSDERTAVPIGGPTVMHAVLPSCPFGSNYGTGLAGKGGIVPTMTTSGGAPRVGNKNFAFELQDGVGSGFAAIVFGIAPTSLPVLGGTLLVDPFQVNIYQFRTLSGPFGVAGAGSKSIPMASGIDGSLSGLSLYSQFAVFDQTSVEDWAISDGLVVTFCE